MSEIKAGDLVMIVRSRCCVRRIGEIFTVTKIRQTRNLMGVRCNRCGNHTPDALVAEGSATGMVALLNVLKRIPPLAELESTETKEVLHA